MKKLLIITLIVFASTLAFAEYQVGDVVNDYTWTDNTGAQHSIYEMTAEGTAIAFFWGGTG